MITEQEARSHLDHLLTVVEQRCTQAVRELNDTVLNDPRFFDSPGGSEHHHAYRHGLVEHVSEVMDNALAMGATLNFDQQEMLVTAVIWHDFMKVLDYRIITDLNGEDRVGREPYQKLINHVSGSHAAFVTACTLLRMYPASGRGIGEELMRRVQHCLLSHHGRREWGSPVEPQTVEAYILHAADMMSSRGVNL